MKIRTLLSIIIVVLSLFFNNLLSAQDRDTSHLSFMGVPIDGTPYALANKLKQKGLEKIPFSGNGAGLKGTFATVNNCYILIRGSYSSGIAYEVTVGFPKKEDWASLEYSYLNIKSLLTKKYGNPDPDLTSEEFLSPYYKGDGYEMIAVEAGKCNYSCTFFPPQGMVFLSITDDASLILVYSDNKNSDLNYQELHSEAINDL